MAGHNQYVGLRISDAPGAVPSASQIGEGELAFNLVDKRIFARFGNTVHDITDGYSQGDIDQMLGTAAARDASDFDPAGSAAAVELRTQEVLRRRPDPLLTSLVFG